jgi:hypothetical protein
MYPCLRMPFECESVRHGDQFLRGSSASGSHTENVGYIVHSAIECSFLDPLFAESGSTTAEIRNITHGHGILISFLLVTGFEDLLFKSFVLSNPRMTPLTV